MTETREDLGSIRPASPKEAEPRAPRNLVISTDISSGEYLPGKKIPFERDDGLALLMVRTAGKAGLLRANLIGSTFGNVSGGTSYRILEQLQGLWGGGGTEIVQGAVKSREPSQAFVARTLELLRTSLGPLTLVALGPFTDVAEVARRAKEEGLGEKIQEIVLSASREDLEEVSRDLSFNTKHDPRALDTLRESGIPLIYGWDGVLRHAVTRELTHILENSSDPLARFVSEGLERRNRILVTLSKASEIRGRKLIGVLPGAEQRKGRMCIQDMIIPVYLARPDLFDREQTQYGWRVKIKDTEEAHREVDEEVASLVVGG